MSPLFSFVWASVAFGQVNGENLAAAATEEGFGLQLGARGPRATLGC